MDNAAVYAIQNQFESTYKMLKDLINLTPDYLWNTSYHGVPMWKQVYHVVYYIDYWLRLKYDDSEFRRVIFDERISPELNIHTEGDLSITRSQMADYLEKIHIKTEQFFRALQDEDLAAPIITGVKNYTYLDVITGQIRHIMYNLGYCNAILREQKLPEADWYSYNEKED